MYESMIGILSLAYEKLRRRNVHSCRRILERTQWLKREELRSLQLAKLRSLLEHAYRSVPYYHELFRKAGFHPSDFSRFEDLQRIPALQRSDLSQKSNKLLAKDTKKSELFPLKTSGTTASPVRFYRSKMDIDWDLAAQQRGYAWSGYETGAKLLYIRLFDRNDEQANAKNRLMRFIKRWKLLGGYSLSEKSLASFCLRTCRYEPAYILGGACTTNILATFLLKNSQFRMRPKAVFTYGETLLPHYRKMIEEAFKSKVIDWYGSTEIASISCQCGQHDGHHVSDENVLLEIEKDGESASPGEEGRVLLTNLNSFAMPFIRYDIGDQGQLLPDNCPCGRGLSLFKPVGRTNEYFVHSDGTFTFLRDLQTVFEDLPIEDYQIVQESYDEIAIRIVRRPGYTKADSDFILKHISLSTSPTARVTVELVDSVPLISFGKVSHLVSKIPTTYT